MIMHVLLSKEEANKLLSEASKNDWAAQMYGTPGQVVNLGGLQRMLGDNQYCLQVTVDKRNKKEVQDILKKIKQAK